MQQSCPYLVANGIHMRTRRAATCCRAHASPPSGGATAAYCYTHRSPPACRWCASRSSSGHRRWARPAPAAHPLAPSAIAIPTAQKNDAPARARVRCFHGVRRARTLPRKSAPFRVGRRAGLVFSVQCSPPARVPPHPSIGRLIYESSCRGPAADPAPRRTDHIVGPLRPHHHQNTFRPRRI